eukprot:TRINITY_DN7352_c0_g1_i2.p1 TRINITY_DN7352_c0_g1~~TRINITY_DN7352_c0_g1_i2.p1  ORF type:complete len:251 (-),score=81.25 TRINITY_DN7352_c0_g1_i2:132-836(-)
MCIRDRDSNMESRDSSKVVSEDLVKAIVQSEQAFRNQFDPNSLLFHNGDPTPVPLGGVRQPKSMPTVYSDQLNDAEAMEEFLLTNPEYNDLIARRDQLGELKKAVSQVPPILEAILRHRDKGNHIGTQKAEQKKHELIAQEKVKLDVSLKELASFGPIIASLKYTELIGKDLATIEKRAKEEFPTKEELTDFGFFVKKVTQKIFNEQKRILDQIKILKKKLLSNPKPAEEKKTD